LERYKGPELITPENIEFPDIAMSLKFPVFALTTPLNTPFVNSAFIAFNLPVESKYIPGPPVGFLFLSYPPP
jgi:hypothetical protein